MFYIIIISTIKTLFIAAKYMPDAFSSSIHSTCMSVSYSPTIPSLPKLIQEYTDTLNPFELQGLAIAKDHLGPSFDMKRSSGFLRWMDARR
jgi:hypothetical protein